MTDIDLDALEATARAATPGPWVLDNSGWSKPYDIPDRIAGGVTDDDWTNVIMPQDEQGGGSWSRDEDATHIATFDPPTVLALIARLREAEAAIDKVDALAAHFAGRAMEAEAVIEAIDAIEPMWPRGMYGAPQDMIGRNQIRPIITRYKTTKTEGSAHRNHTPGVYQDATERNENGKES